MRISVEVLPVYFDLGQWAVELTSFTHPMCMNLLPLNVTCCT